MRCGITGLRPTYGRVARTGAMTLCWSLDKLGPMTRSVEDAMLVLHAITGPDAGDVASVPSRLDFDAAASVAGLRVGYFPKWMNENPATAVDRAAVDVVKKVGMVPVEVSIPDWPYDSLNLILFAEGAAAFEELTLSGGLRELKAQVPDAWPNIFRQARFLSAVDFVQADRLRRKVAEEMARSVFESRPAAGAFAARRNVDDHQLHRASGVGPARGIRRSCEGAQRLGARSESSAADFLAAAPRAPWRDADRTAVRGRHDGQRRARARACFRSSERASAGILSANSAGWRFFDAWLTGRHPLATGMLVNDNRATQSDIYCVARWQLVVGVTSWYGSFCVLVAGTRLWGPQLLQGWIRLHPGAGRIRSLRRASRIQAKLPAPQ